MKLDFSPRLELTWVAVGIGGASLIEGGIQAISGASKAKQARNAIKNQATPQYAPNKAVNDYYQTALNRYNAGPYNSAQYLTGKKAADTGLATGIAGLQDRRSGVGNIGALTGGYSNSLQKLGAQAEQTQRQNFAQLGQASNAQLNDSRFAYQQNQVAPYQKNLQLDYAQLGGANSLISSGLTNINSGLSTGANAYMGYKRSGGSGGVWGNNTTGNATFGSPQYSGWGFQQ